MIAGIVADAVEAMPPEACGVVTVTEGNVADAVLVEVACGAGLETLIAGVGRGISTTVSLTRGTPTVIDGILADAVADVVAVAVAVGAVTLTVTSAADAVELTESVGLGAERETVPVDALAIALLASTGWGADTVRARLAVRLTSASMSE